MKARNMRKSKRGPIVIGPKTIPSDEYHADSIAPEPSLSASIAKIIWAKSPLHAFLASPRLNPDYVREEKDAFDLGTAAHDMLLEGATEKLCVIDPELYPSEPKKKGEPGSVPKGWTNNAIKEARDLARSNGLTPLLPWDYYRVQKMVEAARKFLDTTELAGILSHGRAEQSMWAQYEGVWIRCRTDWLSTDRRIILDFKTTDASAKPESWIRRNLFQLGYDIQAASNLLCNELTGGPPDARFFYLVQETEAPYLCSLIEASPNLVECGRRKFDFACRTWRRCLDTGEWPGYGSQTVVAEPPAWEMIAIEESEILEIGYVD